MNKQPAGVLFNVLLQLLWWKQQALTKALTKAIGQQWQPLFSKPFKPNSLKPPTVIVTTNTLPGTTVPRQSQLLQSLTAKVGVTPVRQMPPSTSYTELVRADAYRYCRRWKEAQAIYRGVLERYHAELETAQRAEAWVGNLLCWEQLAGAAIASQKALEALKACPLDKTVLWETARLAKEAGDWRLVTKSLQRLTRLEPSHTEAWFELALACELLEQWQKAQHAYKQVLALEPDCLAAGHNLANIALRQEDMDEAKQGFKALLNKAPNFAKAQLGLALCLDKQGNARQAVFYYKQYLHLKPLGGHSVFAKQRLTRLQTRLLKPVTAQTSVGHANVLPLTRLAILP